MNHRTTRTWVAATAATAALVSTGAVLSGAVGVVRPGTAGNDVTVGQDNDNATNTFIQPPGVTAKQHMDNTDILFGRGGADLLIGKLGGDTLLAGAGDDITVGGPEAFAAPNSDVLIGEGGNDVNIWAPGDGSDAFLGDSGRDTMVFAPFVTKADGSLLIQHKNGRRVPRVDVDGLPQFSCTIVPVPASQDLGVDFLVRFNVNGTPAVTVRQRDVERVLCPSPHAGTVLVAHLDDMHPQFASVPIHEIGGVTGDIIAPAPAAS